MKKNKRKQKTLKVSETLLCAGVPLTVDSKITKISIYCIIKLHQTCAISRWKVIWDSMDLVIKWNLSLLNHQKFISAVAALCSMSMFNVH